MDSNVYNDKLKDFSQRIKAGELTKPLQEVKPVDPIKEKVPETQLNLWIPKELKKQLQKHAADQETSLKEVIIAALEKYLKEPKEQ